MIDEAVLERLLAAEAETYEPPADGPQWILDVAAETEDRRPRRTPWLAAAAAAVVIGLGIPLVNEVGGSAVLPSMSKDSSTYATSGGKTASDDGGLLVEYDRAPAEPSVVRTGNVLVHVPKKDVAGTLRAAARIAGAYGGFVAGSSTQTAGDRPEGYVDVRVPVRSYDRAVEDATRLGDVQHADTSAEDVTDQVTDTAARLRSLTATRAQLQALMARADGVEEVLAVQQRLTEVQTQIEKLDATRASLADKTAYGTLRITVAPPGGGQPGRFGRAWDQAVDGFVGGAEWLVSVSGGLAFGLILVGLLLVAGRRAYRYWVRGVL